MTARRNMIALEAACAVAHDEGLNALTRDKVARRAALASGSVTAAFGDMPGLRDAVMREAVSRPILSVLAQGLAARDAIACAAPADLRLAALATVS